VVEVEPVKDDWPLCALIIAGTPCEAVLPSSGSVDVVPSSAAFPLNGWWATQKLDALEWNTPSMASEVLAGADAGVGAAADGGGVVPMDGGSGVNSLAFGSLKGEASVQMLVCYSRLSFAWVER
jgi:hypothetical protein